MSSLYSETLLRSRLVGNVDGWFVPAGKRAVVRSISMASTEGLSQWSWAAIAGYYVALRNIQASEQFFSFDLRHVAYAGEVIQVWNGAQGMSVVVSGYLFDDPGAELADGQGVLEDWSQRA